MLGYQYSGRSWVDGRMLLTPKNIIPQAVSESDWTAIGCGTKHLVECLPVIPQGTEQQVDPRYRRVHTIDTMGFPALTDADLLKKAGFYGIVRKSTQVEVYIQTDSVGKPLRGDVVALCSHPEHQGNVRVWPTHWCRSVGHIEAGYVTYWWLGDLHR